jgi:hypothetical protein
VNLDLLVNSKTRFFAAASATSQALADVAVPGFGRAGASAETRGVSGKHRPGTGEGEYRSRRQDAFRPSGEVLDRGMVHKEQTADDLMLHEALKLAHGNPVQKQLDQLKATNPEAYGTALREINSFLNNSGAVTNSLVGLGNLFFPTDKAYFQFMGGVRKSLGHDIDFANQRDREAIGNALIKHIRERGGCDIAGYEISGCER